MYVCIDGVDFVSELFEQVKGEVACSLFHWFYPLEKTLRLAESVALSLSPCVSLCSCEPLIRAVSLVSSGAETWGLIFDDPTQLINTQQRVSHFFHLSHSHCCIYFGDR